VESDIDVEHDVNWKRQHNKLVIISTLIAMSQHSTSRQS